MTRKLTRQERKEALAKYDWAIKACESRYDATGDLMWQDKANDLQGARAAALDKIEGRTAAQRDPWKST